jgi:hypothetical protein
MGRGLRQPLRQPQAPILASLGEGQSVLFDIDFQGSQSIYDYAPADTVRVYILPPSLAEMSRRLHARAQDSEEVILKRLGRAKAEVALWSKFDYVILNDDFDRAYAELAHIYHAERSKRARNLWVRPFVQACWPSRSRARLRQSQESRHVDCLGPRVRVDAGGFAQGRPAQRLQARAQHLAALAEGGGGDALQRLQLGFGRLSRARVEPHHRRGHFRRRGEGAGRQVHDDAGVGTRPGRSPPAAHRRRRRPRPRSGRRLPSGTSGSSRRRPGHAQPLDQQGVPTL